MPGISFGDLSPEYRIKEDARIVVIPVPYDRTSTWRRGARKGPRALLEASAHMELYDLETSFEVYKLGIFTEREISSGRTPESMIQAVKKNVSEHLEGGRFPVIVGGEHTVSLGSVFAHQERESEFSVLQLDAHTDLRESYEGSTFNHACVMARVREACPSLVQVGIRSMDESERRSADLNRIFPASEIHRERGREDTWHQRLLSLLGPKVYITLDLDVFDPSIMPSTGTPEPGGLDWYDVLSLLRRVFEEKRVLGFDIVELCPGEDKAPDFLAAKLLYTLLSYRFYRTQ
ncbi:MAG TPA: agmatinase, partial [Spirochaetia bacterium]|nr:agmatinase [Spirochaetia bacterium]